MRIPTYVLCLLSGIHASAAPLSYNRDVRPILSEYCFACHGPDPNTREAKLRLDVREEALKKDAFVPGDPEASELIYRIMTDDEDDLMPPSDSHKTLSAEQKRILQEWIKQGAEYEPHWAYIVPDRPQVPAMGAAHPIDNFILAGMKESGLKLAPPADPHSLARRLAFDLTGLPPQTAATPDPAAMIDILLASPHFGERMAVFWLDLARYADTVGYHGDQVRDVTPYRDYVIAAFNKNKPYDQFITEQLAGDLLENPTTEHYVATAFNRVNQLSEEGGIQDAEYIAKTYAERVRTTSVAFLGSTMGCAECHDHKFDPFTTRDFYAMEAFFADVYEKGAYSGVGRYNPGADIKKYPGFHLTKWGPALKVPEPEQSEELKRIASERTKTQAELDKTTPELEKAFREWLVGLQSRIKSRQPWDITILDDNEHPFNNAKTITDNVHSGRLARRQEGKGVVQHIANLSKSPVTVAQGDVLFAHVWLDPDNPPKQIMLQFHAGNWEHRAWWGEALIPHGKEGNKPSGFRVGKLPETGKWVRLEVPAAKVGLPAKHPVTQMAFTQHGGIALWDLTGRRTSDVGSTLTGLSKPARDALLASAGKKLDPKWRDPLLAYYRGIAPSLDPVRKRLADLAQEEKALQGKMRSTLVTLAAPPREIRVLPRGNWMDKSGEVVLPSIPAFLAESRKSVSKKDQSERLDRLDLARWVASRDNPLTARAFVNRLWALFFDTGLSRDLQDLGNQGRWPTHPELLDWLAAEFVESGWDVKHLTKLILTSKTYQQSSNASAELLEKDPYNEYYARQNARRLPAEFVRDNALAVSGLLNRKIGGASARPYQPPGYYAQLNFPKRSYKPDSGPNQYRRGLYMHWQRSFLHPMLVAFDAPAREECTASRESSNTPLQALNLLNDPTFVEAARVFAQKLTAEHPSFPARLEAAFQQLLARTPTSEETALLTKFYNRQLTRYQSRPADAKALLGVGLSPAHDKLDPTDLAATTATTRALFSLHETITRY